MENNPQNQVSNVVKLRFPVDYENGQGKHKTIFGSDIVILVLGEEIKMDKCSIRPIKLPPPNYRPIGHEKNNSINLISVLKYILYYFRGTNMFSIWLGAF